MTGDLYVQWLVSPMRYPNNYTIWFNDVRVADHAMVRSLVGSVTHTHRLELVQLAGLEAAWQPGGYYPDVQTGTTRLDLPNSLWTPLPTSLVVWLVRPDGHNLPAGIFDFTKYKEAHDAGREADGPGWRDAAGQH